MVVNKFLKQKNDGCFICVCVWLLLFIASGFTVTSRFMDASLLPKWYATGMVLIVGGLLSMLFLTTEKEFNKRNIYLYICRVTNLLAFTEALISIGQIFHLIPYFTGCSVGTFDNLAGFTTYICLTFPIGFSYYKTYKKIERLFFIILKSVSIVAIIMNEARIGIICMLLVMIIIACKKRQMIISVSLLFLIISIPVFAFLLKTGSTKGRWFVIERTINMIKEHPFIGWGHNGFFMHYMDEQAHYFSCHPNNPYAFYANNIHHPLNEFLLITVNYGLPILSIPLISLMVVVKYYQKNKSSYSKEGIIVIICILLLSTFSYPFSYPQTWLMLILGILLIFSRLVSKFKRNNALKIFKLPVAILFVISGCFLINYISLQLEWKKASEMFPYNSEEAKTIYSKLYESLNNDFAFLYDYGREMYFDGEYRQAEILARKASNYISDYDLQLLLGDIYSSLGKKQDAINAYQVAANMCPSRIVPLYEIYKIYSYQNDSTNCVSIYNRMVNTRYKRVSTDVLIMLHKVEADCKRFTN